VNRDGAPRGSFRERLEVIREFGWQPVKLDDEFRPVQAKRAATEVADLLGQVEPHWPQGLDYDALVDRVRNAWQEHASLTPLNKRDLRHLPWILFYPQGRQELWLGGDSRLVQEYGRWLTRERRSSTIISFLFQYLATYPVELSTLDTMRTLLRGLILDGDNLRLHRWRDRCTAFQILEERGPERMGRAWWDSRQPADEFLAEAGLTGGLEGSKFLREATAFLTRWIGSQLASGGISSEELVRGLTWIEKNEGGLRFEELRLNTAEALLKPFEESNPQGEIETILRSFFLRCYGDPRLPRTTGWNNIDERYKSVMRRWLVRLDLDDFFRLLDKTADPQWQYRKAFWSAYLERDLISDTWIVLGRQAATIARRTFEHGDRAAARLLSGSGVRPNHSVLLMRLGQITVAEWSHMGKCRFWLESNRDAPGMYRREYRRIELVSGADFEQVHYGAERGRWQGQISSWIYRNTGVRLSSHEYMPGGGKRWY